MKLKDLKVGEEYAAGSKRYPDRVTLLSVGGWVPYRSNAFSIRGRAAHEEEGAKGCRVDHGQGHLDVITPAQIHCTWAEHEEREAKKEVARIEAATDRNERADRATGLGKRLNLLLSKRIGEPFARAYLDYSDSPERQDAYLDGLSELVALAERAGRGEG